MTILQALLIAARAILVLWVLAVVYLGVWFVRTAWNELRLRGAWRRMRSGR